MKMVGSFKYNLFFQDDIDSYFLQQAENSSRRIFIAWILMLTNDLNRSRCPLTVRFEPMLEVSLVWNFNCLKIDRIINDSVLV